MDRLLTLEMFVAVASEGGFAAAARKLARASIFAERACRRERVEKAISQLLLQLSDAPDARWQDR